VASHLTTAVKEQTARPHAAQPAESVTTALAFDAAHQHESGSAPHGPESPSQRAADLRAPGRRPSTYRRRQRLAATWTDLRVRPLPRPARPKRRARSEALGIMPRREPRTCSILRGTRARERLACVGTPRAAARGAQTLVPKRGGDLRASCGGCAFLAWSAPGRFW